MIQFNRIQRTTTAMYNISIHISYFPGKARNEFRNYNKIENNSNLLEK